MSLLRKRGWWQAMFHSRLTVLILLVLTTAISFAVYDRYVIEREMLDRRQTKEAQLQGMEDRRDSLQERVQYLQGEQGVESEIRKYFDVALEGEKVIVLVGESNVASEGAATSKVAPESSHWWQFFLPWTR